MAGAPDFANVKRHFYARTIDTQSLTLTANQFVGHAYTADQMGDCAMVRVIASPGVCVLVDAYGVSGDVAESWKLMQSTTWPRAFRLPVPTYGGGMDVLVQDTTGVGGKTCVYQVEQYIGITALELGPFQRSDSTGLVNLANAALLPAKISLPDAMYYDRLSLWISTAGQPMNLGIDQLSNGGIASTAGTIGVATVVYTVTAANNNSVIVDVPTAAPLEVNVQNNSGAAANVMLNARLYKAA